jgi:tRNA modification GTPase
MHGGGRDTIFALSSGQPPAAIGVIRISGPEARGALEVLAGRVTEARRAALVELRAQGATLDTALALRFEGPHSATGEDLVELHVHGGRAVVAAVLAALSQLPGLRAAEPGEFTRRAFLNGRLDLAEAEGLADLLAAETESQRRAAIQLAGGALSRLVGGWTQRLLRLAAAVEAQLDFSDEGDVDSSLPPEWHEERERLAGEIDALLARPPAERLRDGVRVVIAGPPNSGKSTLLNALAEREAAITSEIAGTTRDLIEVPVAIAGVPLLLIDSAGLRESGDRIEAIGVGRAAAAIAAADLVLWLDDAAAAPDRAGVIRLHTKSDLGAPPPSGALPVSAQTGEGMGALIERLLAEARTLLPPEGEVAINARQRAALAEVLNQLGDAGREQDLVLVAEALRLARSAFDRITGRAGVEDMLDTLFGRFCIGK